MGTGNRNIRVHLSQQCFDLLADAMCALSKRTGRFQTMRMAVQAACEGLKREAITKDEVDQFLSEFSVDGEIAVWLEITPKWAPDYDEIRSQVKRFSGKPAVDKLVLPFAVYLADRRGLM